MFCCNNKDEAVNRRSNKPKKKGDKFDAFKIDNGKSTITLGETVMNSNTNSHQTHDYLAFE